MGINSSQVAKYWGYCTGKMTSNKDKLLDKYSGDFDKNSMKNDDNIESQVTNDTKGIIHELKDNGGNNLEVITEADKIVQPIDTGLNNDAKITDDVEEIIVENTNNIIEQKETNINNSVNINNNNNNNSNNNNNGSNSNSNIAYTISKATQKEDEILTEASKIKKEQSNKCNIALNEESIKTKTEVIKKAEQITNNTSKKPSCNALMYDSSKGINCPDNQISNEVMNHNRNSNTELKRKVNVSYTLNDANNVIKSRIEMIAINWSRKGTNQDTLATRTLDAIIGYLHNDKLTHPGIVYMCKCTQSNHGPYPLILLIKNITNVVVLEGSIVINRYDIHCVYVWTSLRDSVTDVGGSVFFEYDKINKINKFVFENVTEYGYNKNTIGRSIGFGCIYLCEIILPKYIKGKCEWNNWDEYFKLIRLQGHWVATDSDAYGIVNGFRILKWYGNNETLFLRKKVLKSTPNMSENVINYNFNDNDFNECYKIVHSSKV